MKKLLLSFLALFATFAAYAQVTTTTMYPPAYGAYVTVPITSWLTGNTYNPLSGNTDGEVR